MKLSCHLSTWGNEYITGLDQVSALGFHGCEVFTRMAFEYEDRIEDFRELLDSRGMILSGLHGGGRFGEQSFRRDIVNYCARVARFLATVGSDRMILSPTGPRTNYTRENFNVAAQTLCEVADVCYEFGVVPCLHPHLQTDIQNEAEIEIILELTASHHLQLCIDTAHQAIAGVDLGQLITRYQNRIGYLHVKDVSPSFVELIREDRPENLPVNSLFCEVGAGILDFPDLKQRLEAIQYDGWLTVELNQSGITPFESTAISRDYLVQKLGLRQ
ncbi:inosose dehydratase [Paenibacillus sp. yr247]|uniref:sugar phosphate isomerase/epimerase family protein n=1 Tax=Paenibacillus sp. yr247 TaxID=1761880 RepID=UPI000880208B|nr:sugar phosphate isomerase/epimerase [Paenibacillus sp. yr247]SDO37437.1 inosose dehydratase [Paenibacillus sp. yr247]